MNGDLSWRRRRDAETNNQAARADCECGYSINATTAPDHKVYTELLETDFLHLQNITLDTDWVPQEYNITASAARGSFGEARQLGNVIANPLLDNYSYAGASKLGGDPGLQLWVRAQQTDGLIGTAEISSAREDMLYGSFRVAMKLTGIPGTCGAFFWYYNNTQEIDLEYLSRLLNTTSSPLSLVLQSPASAHAGYDASSTPTYQVHQLPFHPSTGYHEYRFDWTPGAVSFYADGVLLTTMTGSAVPTSPGHILLNHWSNGNAAWSGGPPATDAALSVSYVKAYFNSSLDDRKNDYAQRCNGDTAAQNDKNAICIVPDQTTAPDPDSSDGNKTANTFFFSGQANMTTNQTVYTPAAAKSKKKSGAGATKDSLRRGRDGALGLLVGASMVAALLLT
ncbi:MAG: hypothetical protein M1819_000631 [Sarea resinae]|nr:MAG: hypothetical protein M1819_000631 [Sarea resinae]